MDPHFDGVIFQSHAAELGRRIHHPYPPYRVIDVRSAPDYAAGRIPGALSATPSDLAGGLPEGTTPSTEFFIVGRALGDRVVRAASRVLAELGANRIVEVPGGMDEWSRLGLPVETDAAAA